MRISVFGCGHVGLTTAACLAHLGHDVLGVDDDAEKIELIARGGVPFHEPLLPDLVREGLAEGRLRVSTDTREAARHGDVVFICVGTPTRESGEADLEQVERVAAAVARNVEGYTVVAEKSTVPVETSEWIRRTMRAARRTGAEFDVVCNPEFLREGRAVRDSLEPDRIVVGATSPRALDRMRELYRPILDRSGCPFVATDVVTAELVKHASNAYLATKISFINMVADVCERVGADVETVAAAMGMDARIGAAFLGAGIGYGGACLPKDVAAFRYKGEQLGLDLSLLREVDRINDGRAPLFLKKVRSAAGGVEGRTIAVWGLAFKGGTDDLRNSPALKVARDLLEEGARVTAYDPVAVPEAKSLLPGASFALDPYEAARGADCLVVLTDWREFASVDLGYLRAVMARPLVVDGRNLFRPEEMAKAGFQYASIGRPSLHPTSNS